MQALAEQARIVRLPLNQLGAANKVKKAFSELEQKFEREPSPEELSAVLDLPMDKVTNTMKMPGKHVSMDAPLVQGEDSTLLDVLENGDSLGADSALINESLQKEINRSLATLSEREQDVIKMFYGIGIQHGLSLEEIGEKFDLTSERVRQIKEKAIKTLRQNSRNKLLKAYLG
jgi:RNA polymerase primary sigma factor